MPEPIQTDTFAKALIDAIKEHVGSETDPDKIKFGADEALAVIAAAAKKAGVDVSPNAPEPTFAEPATRVLSLRIPREEHAAIVATAKARGCSVSSLVRGALAQRSKPASAKALAQLEDDSDAVAIESMRQRHGDDAAARLQRMLEARRAQKGGKSNG
jgi:hypothetical protein